MARGVLPALSASTTEDRAAARATPEPPACVRGASLTVVDWLTDVLASVVAWWGSLPEWWTHDGWPWISDWMKSPGFAGFAAVVAAALAFFGARHQARLNAWWQRIEWALNLYTKPDSIEAERMAGLAAIGALQRTRLARRAEQDFVSEIIGATTLDPLGDGIETDDLSEDLGLNSGFTQPDEPYSDQETKEASDDEERIPGEDRPTGPVGG